MSEVSEMGLFLCYSYFYPFSYLTVRNATNPSSPSYRSQLCEYNSVFEITLV